MSKIFLFVLLVRVIADTTFFCKVVASDTYLHPSSVEWISFRNVSLENLEPAGWGNSPHKPYYLARTKFRGEWFPGYVCKGDHNIWFGYGGREHNYKEYELLVAQWGALIWVPYSNNYVLPKNAFSGGIDPLTKEPIFICRNRHIDKLYGDELLLPGKLKRRLRRCGITQHREEHFYDEFEVLVDARPVAADANVTSVDNCTSSAAEWLHPAQVSRDQVILGGEVLGYPVFIGRTRFEGYQLPGYVINEENTILIEVNKSPINQSDFELLACVGKELAWKQASSSAANETELFAAFIGGEDPKSGEPLHVCRTQVGEHTIPGRIQQSPFSCVFRFGDEVFQTEDFEILVDTRRRGVGSISSAASRDWTPRLIATELTMLLVIVMEFEGRLFMI